MADIENATNTYSGAGVTERSLFADPTGWTSTPPSLDKIKGELASTVGAKPSQIQDVLEEQNLDQYIFSYDKTPGADTFYLFSSGSADTYQVVSPTTQKALWDALKYNDWRDRLKLKEL